MSTDWFPGSRDGQLTMAKNWGVITTAQAVPWGIPEAVITALGALTTQADGVLAAAKNDTTRTPVVTAKCREIFGGLEDSMRDFKRRYFLTPPLTEADIIALGLKPHDATPTAGGTPAAQVTIETYLVGRHELGLRIVYVSGNPDDPANKEFRIWYRVVGPGEDPPRGPEELGNSFSTKRKKEAMDFGPEASGKTVYFAVQVENGKLKGPWGPTVSALIP